MLITFGKYKKSSVASVVLKDPDYVRWVLRQENPEGALSKVKNEMKNLIAAFDSMPIMRKCNGLNCQEKSTLFSTYSGSASSLFFWCDLCNPYQCGANKGKLTTHKTYKEALEHIDFSCNGTKAGYKAIIRGLAIAKGLPKRSGEVQIAAFFA